MKSLIVGGLLLLVGVRGVAQVQENVISELVLLNVRTGEEKSILRQNRHFEAPNWSREGDFLLINSGGQL